MDLMKFWSFTSGPIRPSAWFEAIETLASRFGIRAKCGRRWSIRHPDARFSLPLLSSLFLRPSPSGMLNTMQRIKIIYHQIDCCVYADWQQPWVKVYSLTTIPFSYSWLEPPHYALCPSGAARGVACNLATLSFDHINPCKISNRNLNPLIIWLF